VRGGADDSERQAEPLPARAAGPRDQAQRDGRQRLAGAAMVVLGRAPVEARPPEGGDIDGDGPIAVMPVWPPLPFVLHDAQPLREEPVARPLPLPQRGPRPAHLRVRQPQLTQAGEQRPARAQEVAAHEHPQQIEQAAIRPDRQGDDQRA